MKSKMCKCGHDYSFHDIVREDRSFPDNFGSVCDGNATCECKGFTPESTLLTGAQEVKGND